MTGPTPGGAPRRFTPGELDDVAGMRPDELAAELRIARELEGLAVRSDTAPSASFADRVMDAVATEPSPAPARAAGRAIRRRSAGALVLSIRDAWRVTVRPGFPMAVRAQAFALVLVVLIVGTASAAATAGAIGLLRGSDSVPSPDVTIESPPPSISPSLETPSQPTPSQETAEPSPSESPEASESAGEETASPGETEEPDASGDDSGGGSGSSSGSRSGPGSGSDDDGDSDSGPGSEDSESRTPRPRETPEPGKTPKPSETPHDEESGGSGGSGSDD